MTVQTMTVHPPARDGAVNIVLHLDRSNAFVRIAGDVDMSDAATLAEAYDQLAWARPHAVCLDLADVTFAGSTLVNFIVRLQNAMAEGTRFAVCRATPMALRVLTVCRLASRLEISARLPDDWPQPAATASPSP
jgi:anti-anti-sigma factor